MADRWPGCTGHCEQCPGPHPCLNREPGPQQSKANERVNRAVDVFLVVGVIVVTVAMVAAPLLAQMRGGA